MFKRWSIKQLLQFWTAATVVVVTGLGLMVNHLSTLISDSRDILTERVLPVENSSRELSRVATALSQRQKHILRSDALSAMAKIHNRDQLEQQFEQTWLHLTQVLSTAPKYSTQADALFSYYQDFLNLDDDISRLKQQSLQLSARLQQHSDDIAIQSGQIRQQLVQLQQSLRQQNRLNLLALLEPVQHAVYQLGLLNYQAMTTSRDQQLQQMAEQQLAPLKADMDQQMQVFKNAVSGQPGLAEPVDRLGYDIEVLIALIAGEDGLFQLHEQWLLSRALLEQTEQSAVSVMGVISDKIGQMTDFNRRQSITAINSHVSEADKNRWLIVGLSVLLILGIMIFAWMLVGRINKPLMLVRRSIQAMSEGRFDTRIDAADDSKELALLAGDFNTFADNTGQMLDALNKARQSLQEREQHIRAVLNGVPEAILTLSDSGTINDVNPGAELVLGGTKESLCGENLLSFIDQKTFDSIEALAAKSAECGEFEGRRLDGTTLSIWLSLSRVDSADEKVWVCVISDVTERKQTDLQLQQLMAEQEAILENAIIGIAFVRDRRFIRVNRRFEELFGFDRDQIIEQSTIAVYPNEQAYHQFGEQAYTTLKSNDSFEAQLELVKNNGDKFWCAMSGKALNPQHPQDGSIWLFEDVTQQRENEEYLTKLASIDALTGLPNRTVFNDRVEHAIHKTQRDAGRLAVFFLDLDHFKHINDSLGHKAGDVLLKDVAVRIKSCLREGDTVARLGGDEFTLLLEDINSAEHVGKVAEKVIHAMTRPFKIESTEISISPSIGISLYPADGRTVDMLVRNADAAMYHAKKLGRNNFQFYSLEMNAEAAEKLAMETALRQAVDKQDFFLHYQPQFDLQTGEMAGAEVLLRWHSKQWGAVPPSRFVPVLEDTGLIGQVGEWILRQACDTFLELQQQLPAGFKMAVNLSGRQFKGGLLAGDIRQLLRETGMPARNLELEITETMLMEDTELATLTLEELSAMGISLAIDDFGTGYSSLSYLKQFPLDVLKIDGSFIRDVIRDQEDAAIVDAIMAISGSLGLVVVAEGVETSEQLDYLRNHQCQRGQGYLLARPVDKAAFIALTGNELSV